MYLNRVQSSIVPIIGTMHKTITTSRYQELVKWLRDERLAAGLTLRDLGTRLGVPHSFIQKTETLERRLDVAEYVFYCQGLGLNPADGLRILQQNHDNSLPLGSADPH